MGKGETTMRTWGLVGASMLLLTSIFLMILSSLSITYANNLSIAPSTLVAISGACIALSILTIGIGSTVITMVEKEHKVYLSASKSKQP